MVLFFLAIINDFVPFLVIFQAGRPSVLLHKMLKEILALPYIIAQQPL